MHYGFGMNARAFSTVIIVVDIKCGYTSIGIGLERTLGFPDMARRSAFAQREPNGQWQRRWDQRAASEVRRLREAAWRGLRDAQWGTELGRLHLEGTLTETQFQAGQQWRNDVAAYHWAIDIFPVRTAKLERGKATPADPDSDVGKKLAKHESEAVERFFEAHAVLVLAGANAEKLVRGLVERDEALDGMESLLCVRRGLSALAEYYQLTGGRR
jgi:hypothetical protein